MNSLTRIYDKALADLMSASGYARSALGLYVRSDDATIWRGLWTTFDPKYDTLVAQPNLGIFCPAASRLVQEGLSKIYPSVEKHTDFKLGWPLITQPLYDRVRKGRGEGRMPSSYDVKSVHEIEGVSKLIFEDFMKAEREFFT